MRQAIIFKSCWGWMGISETVKGIDVLVLPKSSKKAVESDLRTQASDSVGNRVSPRLQTARKQVIDYLAGKRTGFDLSLDVTSGTDFQRRVWQVLQGVPYGRLRSYRWVAMRVGSHLSARAVGNAVGANRLPLVIPCHRIVTYDGRLGGFSGGLPVKRKLLALEGTLSDLKA